MVFRISGRKNNHYGHIRIMYARAHSTVWAVIIWIYLHRTMFTYYLHPGVYSGITYCDKQWLITWSCLLLLLIPTLLDYVFVFSVLNTKRVTFTSLDTNLVNNNIVDEPYARFLASYMRIEPMFTVYCIVLVSKLWPAKKKRKLRVSDITGSKWQEG